MTKATVIKLGALIILILATALVSLIFVFVVGGGSGDDQGGSSLSLPSIKLASTAQANVLAQTLALDTSTAGMMAHLDLDIDGLNPLGLSSGSGTSPGFLSSVKERLVGTNGIASLLDFGDNFIIASWCVPNRVNCVNIKLYVDSDGNIAAYLGPTEPSARIWQAGALAVDNPALTDVNFDNILVGGPFSVSQGGIKEVLDSVVLTLGTTINAIPLHDKITYFHFGLVPGVIQPERLLMMGKAFTASNTTRTINFDSLVTRPV